jgi:ATP-dependent DNA helicase DinG
MSATILNHRKYCETVGLDPGQTKFIQVPSEFPINNRPIYLTNVTYLNYDPLKLEDVKREIIRAVDLIMTKHFGRKGITHTTSYYQLNFIRTQLSV